LKWNKLNKPTNWRLPIWVLFVPITQFKCRPWRHSFLGWIKISNSSHLFSLFQKLLSCRILHTDLKSTNYWINCYCHTHSLPNPNLKLYFCCISSELKYHNNSPMNSIKFYRLYLDLSIL